MAKATKQSPKETPPLHLVVYTDGGCKPARGIGGWGFHGYYHTNDLQKKGSGLTTEVPTAQGYLPKQGSGNNLTGNLPDGTTLPCVNVMGYVDGIGNILPEATNNIAELTAATKAFEWAAQCNIVTLTLILDSEYVRKGLLDYLPTWLANGWVKRDGEEVKNKTYWEALHNAKTQVEQQGISVTLLWVKGHSDNPGNDTADANATKGRIAGTKGIVYHDIYDSPASNYWKPKRDINPMFCLPKAYFNTHVDNPRTPDGHYIYYTGNTGWRDDDYPGKEDAEHSLGLIHLKSPELAFEAIKAFQNEQEQEGYNAFIVGNLDVIHNASIYPSLIKTGSIFCQQPYQHNDVYFADEPNPTNLTRDCRPPQLAFRLVDVFNDMGYRLQQTLDSADKTLMRTDITDILYERTEKSVKIRNTINSQCRYLDIEIPYHTGHQSGVVKTPITIGLDTPSRNALAALASPHTKVTLISWMLSPSIVSYATVIQTQTDIGIWCSPYANQRPLLELGQDHPGQRDFDTQCQGDDTLTMETWLRQYLTTP